MNIIFCIVNNDEVDEDEEIEEDDRETEEDDYETEDD